MLNIVWTAIRLPIFMFLVILEPVVTFVLGALALLGVLMSLFFKFYGVPHFPFWLMLSISLGLGLTVIFYQSLIRWFSS